MLHSGGVRHHISKKEGIGELRGELKGVSRTSFRLRQVRQAFEKDEDE